MKLDEMRKHKDFFEFTQGMAQHSLEELDTLLVKELPNFWDTGTPARVEWDLVRSKHGLVVPSHSVLPFQPKYYSGHPENYLFLSSKNIFIG